MSDENRSGYIDDGYTRTDTIPAGKDHPALTLTWRPPSGADWKRLIDSDERGELGDVAPIILGRMIRSWDLKDRNGDKVVPGLASCSRLSLSLLTALIEKLFGKPEEKLEAADQKN